MLRVVPALLLAAFLAACGPTGPYEPTSSGTAPVINGGDDRRELYEVAPDPAREVLGGSVAALMWAHRLRVDADGSLALRTSTLKDALGVCRSERFAEEPSAAHCTGTLIDDDLLLTAAHCLGPNEVTARERCSRLRAVFDYQLTAPGKLAFRGEESVYACRDVIAFDASNAGEGFVDTAILKLDPVSTSERRVVELARRPPEVGERLLAATHGAGLPLKTDHNAVVDHVSPEGGFLVARTDSFGGGSGGPLFDRELGLTAYQVRGAADWEVDGGCAVAASSSTSVEQHQLVSVARATLCDTGWPSLRWCGRAPACGDGLCSGDESAASCAEDCPPSACDDGECTTDELTTCELDCPAFSHVPTTYPLDPATYEPESRDRGAGAAGCSVTARRARVRDERLALVLLAAAACFRANARRRERAGTRAAR